jgi:hypothetical protein
LEINVNSKFVNRIGVNMEKVTIGNQCKFNVCEWDRSEHGESNYRNRLKFTVCESDRSEHGESKYCNRRKFNVCESDRSEHGESNHLRPVYLKLREQCEGEVLMIIPIS